MAPRRRVGSAKPLNTKNNAERNRTNLSNSHLTKITAGLNVTRREKRALGNFVRVECPRITGRSRLMGHVRLQTLRVDERNMATAGGSGCGKARKRRRSQRFHHTET
jgi:hypothetical protein